MKLRKPFRDEPYYVSWVRWCWSKPVYVGLPLLFIGVVPIMAWDTIVLVDYILGHWGGKKEEGER